MPEGPTIILFKEAIQKFKGKKILKATGYAAIDKHLLTNQKITDIKSWGKHTLLCLPKRTIRIHFLLFGSYTIDEKRKANPSLHLHFTNGDLYIYVSSIVILEGNLNDIYDWSADIMNDHWDPKKARQKLKEQPDTLACDALLDQNIFSGSGNIIKNEVLFRTYIHPLSLIGELPNNKLTSLVNEAHKYSFDFLKWKRANVLKKNWEANARTVCPRCDIPLVKEYLGKTKRRTFYCVNCQELYNSNIRPGAKTASTRSTTKKSKKASTDLARNTGTTKNTNSIKNTKSTNDTHLTKKSRSVKNARRVKKQNKAAR